LRGTVTKGDGSRGSRKDASGDRDELEGDAKKKGRKWELSRNGEKAGRE